MIPLNKIKTTVALLLIAILHGISGHAQKYCIRVTMEFKDADAPEAQKAATLEVLNKRMKIQKLQADIKLEKDMIIAKMRCDNYENYRKNFLPDRFGIYETYEAEELSAAMDAIGRIADSLADNAPEIAKGYTAYMTPFEKLLDRNFEGGPLIGVCPIAYKEEFIKLTALPEIQKVLPADLAFVFGSREKDALAVPVYAVKKSDDKTAPVTIGMLKETTVTRSYDKIYYNVDLEFKNEYKAAWASLTKKKHAEIPCDHAG